MHIVVLTGAGISAESGIKTFRDHDGLWEGHDVMEVASPQGWKNNPALVLDFYNQRRRQLQTVEPNAAHHALVDLEAHHEVTIITQNVDDLHERAGSSRIIHLHGELMKARSIRDENLVVDWIGDINLGDTGSDGHQLRPHIVWFGEAVPEIYQADRIMPSADIVLIVGTSLQVYPAAGLVGSARRNCPIYYIDQHPATSYELSVRPQARIISSPATVGVPRVVEEILKG